MSKCSICKKPIPANATECSLACNAEASNRFKRGEAANARSVFSSAMRKMLQPKPRELQPQLEIPMIVVKHRWKRNRTEMIGSVVLKFDKNCVAKIPDVGSNRASVELYCRFSKGLAKIVSESEVTVEEIPSVEPKVEKPKVEPKVEPKEVEKKVTVEPEKKVTEDVTKDVITSAVLDEYEETPVEIPIRKKKPAKKKVGRKSVKSKGDE